MIRYALILFCVVAGSVIATPLLSPRQASAGKSSAMAVAPNTNRVDYILATRVVGNVIQRWHGMTWATNVFIVVDLTNTPAAPPVTRVAVSWDSSVILQSSADLAAWSQLQATATTSVTLPLDAPQKFFRVPLPAQTAFLQWTASPTETVVGYNIYFGTNSGAYTWLLNVGTNTTYRISPLSPGQIYFFAVSAYDNDGKESDLSNEAAYFVPSFEIYPNIQTLH